MSPAPEIVDLLKLWKEFSVPLYFRKGFDEELFSSLCDALRRCAERWHDESLVPRILANILIDMPATVDAAAEGYQDEDATRIRDAAATLLGLAIDCVGVSPEEIEEYERFF